MPRFAANLSMLYTEWPLLQRPQAAAEDGFEALEVQFPYAEPVAAWQDALAAAGRPLVLMNAPAAGRTPAEAAAAWAAGERGVAALPGREDEFRAGFDLACRYALALGVPRLHVMAGCAPAGAAREDLEATLRANLRWAAARVAGSGLGLLVEPLNDRDVPGYVLGRQAQAHALLDALEAEGLGAPAGGPPPVQIQFDAYHAALMEGQALDRWLAEGLARGRLGHLQVAAVPDRGEPDAGTLDLARLFARIDGLGWTGWVGAEYRPRAGTRAGLAGWWARARPQPASPARVQGS